MKNPWGQRGQPALRLAVVALAVVLIGFLVYRQVDRLRGRVITVWVAAGDLPAGTELAPAHLAAIQARTRNLPTDVVPNPGTIGRVALVRPKAKGQLFMDSDFRRIAPDPGPGLLASVPEGRVLMTYVIPGMPINALGSMLRLGDRFDIMAGRRRDEPLHMAHDVVFLGFIAPPEEEDDDEEEAVASVGGTLASSFVAAAQETVDTPPPPSAAPVPLILGVRPEDVRRLVWAQSSGLALYPVFHGRKEALAGELLPFPPEPRPRADQMELILGNRRQRVSLNDPQ